MCFRATLLIVALATLVHTDKLPERVCGMAYVSVEPKGPETLPPVILMHGLSYSKTTWNGIYEKIPRCTERRVIAVDFRDHGESFWSEKFTVPYLVDDLKCFMDAQKIEKAALVGQSLGGLVGMQFALKYPSNVQRLCVEDISPNVPMKVLYAHKKEMDLLLDSEKAVPKNADRDTARKAMVRYIQKVAPGKDPQGVFEQKMPVIFRYGAWHWQTNFQALDDAWGHLSESLGEYHGRYCGKTTFIYGTDSPLKVGEDKEAIKKFFPKAKLYPIRTAQHLIHTKRPKEFYIELLRFLNCKPECINSDVKID